ncbi:hypothetical protein RJT34_31149 [Clitoria ternatea]|uniref:Uncharacterized protein n=1 Tax=Clitoria ternatea TaxID=43366 RepID=A0AAN9I2N1_CLITE
MTSYSLESFNNSPTNLFLNNLSSKRFEERGALLKGKEPHGDSRIKSMGGNSYNLFRIVLINLFINANEEEVEEEDECSEFGKCDEAHRNAVEGRLGLQIYC